MQELTNFSQNENQTMSSKEIAQLTNKEHSNVMRDIRTLINDLKNDESFGGFIFELSFFKSEQNKELPMYQLTKKETLLLVSGYSAILRAKIINRWEELELQKQSQLPTTYIDALKALVASEEAKLLAESNVKSLQIELDKSNEWYSIKKVASINKVSWKSLEYKRLKHIGMGMGYEPKKVFDANFPSGVNAYHIEVWRVAYPNFKY
jgi:Rha family phage regulatory protein